MVRDPTQNCCAPAEEMQRNEARMAEETLNSRNKWPKREAVPG
jgi:hypothetical protein